MIPHDVDIALQMITAQIGPGVSHLNFAVFLQFGEVPLRIDDFSLSVTQSPDGSFRFDGKHRACQITWRFRPYCAGYWVTLELSSDTVLNCVELESLSFDYRPENGAVDALRIPTLGLGVEAVGVFTAAALNSQLIKGTLLRGAFPDHRSSGVFLATGLPQKHQHLYTVESQAAECLHFSAATHYLPAFANHRSLVSETSWLCARYDLRSAIEQYGKTVPEAGKQAVPVGWSSWDYYFFSVTLRDVLENMEEIRHDPVLKQAVKTIVVDDGWQHLNGEWQPNYKFPGGLERLADEIRARGFTAGIWTAPILVNANSAAALRQYDMLVKNQYGDPLPADVPGHYLLDPTHPGGRTFITTLYTRLYKAGFRFFKVDFVSSLLTGQRFYDPDKGVYEVIAELFTMIWACISSDSHLMGCSLPEECGPGLADSRRTGIDIHNQWTHVEWAAQSLQLAGWQHGRLGINDPDFLIVRGLDTSLEPETNVLNPEAHNPQPPRWRRGEVFTLEEARTWGTLVALSGGSIFLSDRLNRLNDVGRGLLRRLVFPTGTAARPLDLGDGPLPALWLSEGEDEYRLGMINWADSPADVVLNFSQYRIPKPDQMVDFWHEQALPVNTDFFSVHLPAHGCFYGYWKKTWMEK